MWLDALCWPESARPAGTHAGARAVRFGEWKSGRSAGLRPAREPGVIAMAVPETLTRLFAAPSTRVVHYPQVVRWTRASGTTGGKGEVPSLAKEGWTRHQVNGSVPLLARPGMSGANVSPRGRNKEEWFVQSPIIGGLNQPPRLRPLRMLRGIFLMGAATPPCPRRGVGLSLASFCLETGRSTHANDQLHCRRGL